MIIHITGHAKFRDPDETIVVDFQPGTGITAVVGPNGVGKTFTASESIRYLLFGTKALRAGLSHVEELDLKGEVEINGEVYTIARSLKTANVAKDGVKIAVGADETTKKCTELLGYGREVFDICNSAMQGQTAALGDLRPEQRKDMLDAVLRVTDVKSIEKALRDEANSLKREASALSSALPVVGAEPIEPKGYEPSDELLRRRDEARAIQKNRTELEGRIVHVIHPDRPKGDRPTQAEVDALAEACEARRKLVAERSELEAKTDAPHPTTTYAEIDAALARGEWELEVERRGPKPELTTTEIDKMLSDHRRREELMGKPLTPVDCPSCGTSFTVGETPPAEPVYTVAQLREQMQRQIRWEEPLPPEPTAQWGSMTLRQANKERELLKAWDEAEAARAQLALLPPLPADMGPELHVKRNALATWGAYESLTARAAAQEDRNDRIRAEIAALPPTEDIDDLSDRASAASMYDRDRELWQERRAAFAKVSSEIATKLERAAQFSEGDKELSEARAELKSFLAPTLSREASELLYDMTNGKLFSLIIDEDMAISVNGRPLKALSGAGKTVANLALRVGITKVITGKAFPVFIGDEMDGDLDEERRQATAQALVSLKQHLKQIILITHRDVDIADQVLDLGEKS